MQLCDIADVALFHDFFQTFKIQVRCCPEAHDFVNAVHDGEDYADIAVDVKTPHACSPKTVNPAELVRNPATEWRGQAAPREVFNESLDLEEAALLLVDVVNQDLTGYVGSPSPSDVIWMSDQAGSEALHQASSLLFFFGSSS